MADDRELTCKSDRYLLHCCSYTFTRAGHRPTLVTRDENFSIATYSSFLVFLLYLLLIRYAHFPLLSI